jgi:NAD(P)-dependent dehydrogenase (short-subunit alcohol dehydrogenase family)
MIDLNGKSAIVTGAGRGIGRAIARELAALGASVALVSRSATELDGVAAEIRERGGTALTVVGDLAGAGEIDRVLAVVRAGFGEPDVLINNAATVAPLGSTARLTDDEVSGSIRLNLVIPIMLTSRVIPGMVGRGWGIIVNISSGIVARPATMIGGTVYAASKAALEAHTINLAAELEGTGVTVNAYRPGMVDTEMQAWIRAQDPARIGERLHDRFTRAQQDGALISAEDSAHALIARLGGEATGQIWSVSGGA